MDATRLDFRDGEFDIVATSMMTHHIDGWERAFSEMVRVLRTGGYLIYTDLAFPSWLARAGRRLIPFIGLPSTGALRSLAVRAGLAAVYEAQRSGHVDAIWLRNA
jgi:ubiquinone/menaquinone biosynthesis C-methylase UbiE